MKALVLVADDLGSKGSAKLLVGLFLARREVERGTIRVDELLHVALFPLGDFLGEEET